MSGPVLLETVVQHYPWGSRTLIPALLGLPAPTQQPWAELWVGAHPGGPSRLPDGRGLNEVEPTLPYLLKLLSAVEPLSLQAHPDAAQAAAGYALEEARGIPYQAPHRTYKDPNPKPELVVALTPFSAVVGFREPAEALRLVRSLGCADLDPLADALDRTDPRDALRAGFTLGMTVPAADRAHLVSVAAAAAAGRAADPATDVADALAYGWVARLAVAHRGDLGALAPLLLHTVELRPGQGLALPARTLHAYLGGAGIEIMGSSDNVVRGGLTSKHVDVDALLEVVDFRPQGLPLVLATSASDGIEVYDTGEAAFRLLRVSCSGAVDVPAVGPRLTLVTAGAVTAAAGGGVVDLQAGRAAYVPAAAGPLQLRGTGTCWVAEPGG